MMDIFGKALMAFYEGDPTPCNIQRDDGYTRVHDLALYFRVYEDWPDYEKSALEYVRGRVLDIGCGAGRHALYLQEKNFEVVAVDASPLAVEVARLRGVTDCSRMSALQSTCRNPLQTNKPEHLAYHDLNRRRGRPIGQITIRTEYKGEINDWFDLLMVEPEVMAEICAEAHWGVETLFESEDTYSSVLTKQ